VASLPSWAFLEPSPETHITMPRPESLRFALLAGFVGGLLGVGLLILMSIGTSLVIPQALQQQEQFLDMYWYARLLFTTLFLALLALVVTARCFSRAWSHGLLAVFVAMIIMTLGLLGISAALGGSASPDFSWLVYAQVATLSILATVPIALAVSTFSTLRRPLRQSNGMCKGCKKGGLQGRPRPPYNPSPLAGLKPEARGNG
jgi:ABC-type transport system involved in multi-copper enzyme maturation permease subunit